MKHEDTDKGATRPLEAKTDSLPSLPENGAADGKTDSTDSANHENSKSSFTLSIDIGGALLLVLLVLIAVKACTPPIGQSDIEAIAAACTPQQAKPKP